VLALSEQSLPRDQYEIIVVDDGSDDGTPDVASAHGAIVIRNPHSGPAIARNVGVRAASGSIVLFTDADCVAAPNWIEEMIRPLQDDPQVAGTKGVYRTKQRSLTARFAQVEFEDRYDRLARQPYIDFVDSHAAAFRREVFLAMGGFDPNFPVANNEDVELSYKIARAGHKMVFAPNAIVYHTHPDTLSRYLYIKLLRGYWRIMVYRKFPEKMISDSYTPQSLKFEIILACLTLLGALLGIVTPGGFALAALAACLFLACSLPFVTFAWRRDRAVALASPALLFLRSTVFALGVVGGVLSHKRRDILIPSLLIGGDLTATALAFLSAYYFRTALLDSVLPPFEHPLYIYLILLPFILAIQLLVFTRRGLYRERRMRSGLGEVIQMTQAFTVVIITVVAVSFFLKWDFSRPLIVLFWLCGLTLLHIARSLVRRLEQNMARKGYHTLRVLLVGTGETARMIVGKFAAHPNMGYKVVGVVEEPGVMPAELPGIPFLGTTAQLADLVQSENIEEVLFAKPAMPHREILNLVVSCENTGASFRILSDLFGIVTQSAAIDGGFDLPVVDLRGDKPGAARRLAKLLFDYTVGAGLLLLLSPIMVLAAIAVKTASRGPVFVTREAVGAQGKRFRQIKFRTDPRPAASRRALTLSRRLQQSGLDELPQLFNVLKGEMSLVGPRPEVPEIVADYDVWQRKRLTVKPGITGLWQLYGNKAEPLHHNLEHDFYYIMNQSLLLDVSILVRTVLPILSRRVQPLSQ